MLVGASTSQYLIKLKERTCNESIYDSLYYFRGKLTLVKKHCLQTEKWDGTMKLSTKRNQKQKTTTTKTESKPKNKQTKKIKKK